MPKCIYSRWNYCNNLQERLLLCGREKLVIVMKEILTQRVRRADASLSQALKSTDSAIVPAVDEVLAFQLFNIN